MVSREKSFGDGEMITKMGSIRMKRPAALPPLMQKHEARKRSSSNSAQAREKLRREWDEQKSEKLPSLLIIEMDRKKKERAAQEEAACEIAKSEEFSKFSESQNPWDNPDIPEELRLPPLRPPTCFQIPAGRRSEKQQKSMRRFRQRKNAYEYMLNGWTRWDEKVDNVRSFYLELLRARRKGGSEVEDTVFDSKSFINSLQAIQSLPGLRRETLKGHSGTELDDAWWNIPEEDDDI